MFSSRLRESAISNDRDLLPFPNRMYRAAHFCFLFDSDINIDRDDPFRSSVCVLLRVLVLVLVLVLVEDLDFERKKRKKRRAMIMLWFRWFRLAPLIFAISKLSL